MDMLAKPASVALVALCLALAGCAAPGKGDSSASTGPKISQKETVALQAARAELKENVAEVTAATPRKGRIWCVPFARSVSGIEISGNAATWWHKAASVYARGKEPKIGAVMNFRASKAMPMGHVAVVSQVVGPREILVDQANWERNRITVDTRVIDVSPQNDWSMVRVAAASGTFGRVNPVYGFIYR
jgi:surface antigen